MTRHGWWIVRCLALGLCLWAASPGMAGAFEMFPAAEVQEAHSLRQRILTEVPQLDPQQLRSPLPPETISLVQQRLAVLEGREAENPFFHWAQGELLRQTQGPAAAAAAFERARQVAGQRALIHWLLWQDFLGRGLRTEAQREERALQAIQMTWGLGRFPLLAAKQMRLASEAADNGELARALALYDSALEDMPGSPEALIRRATLTWQMDKTRLLQVAQDLVNGLMQSLRDPQTRSRLTSNLLLSLLVAWLAALCLTAVILSIKTQPLFGHELNERLLKSFPPPSQWSLGLWLFVLPLMLGLGLLWAAMIALVVSAPYMSRREQGGVSLVLVALLALPFGYEWVAARHIVASSHRLVLARTAEEGGRGETLVQELRGWAREAPGDALPRYYLGQVLKRRGELAPAEEEMNQAAQLLPRAGFVQVGLGNLQYLLGRLPEAEATYGRAAQLLPSSAAIQLNLSKLYTQRLQLDQSNQALTRSNKLDPSMMRTVSYFHGQGLTQFVIDERAPWDALVAGLTPQIEDVRAVADGFWGSPLRGVPLALLPHVAAALLILFWVHVGLRGGTPPVRRCVQCGTPFCRKCQTNPKEKEYCAPCATVFRQREGVAAFVRVRRMREGEEWLRQERARVGILGSVIPGGSDLYTGRLFRGLLLCLLAVWLLTEGLALDLLTPSLRFASPLPVPLRFTVAALLILGLYLYSVRRSWRSPVTQAR